MNTPDHDSKNDQMWSTPAGTWTPESSSFAHPGLAKRPVEGAATANDSPPSRRVVSDHVRACRRVASNILAVACAASGGQSAFARKVGVHHSVAGRWADPAFEEHNVTLADILASGRFAGPVFAAGLAFSDESAPASSLPPERHCLRLQGIVGDLSEFADEASSDGHWDEDEAATMEKLIAKAEDGLARMRRSLRGKR